MPFCEDAHVVYWCRNSQQHLSCWLCTIKANIFLKDVSWDLSVVSEKYFISKGFLPFHSNPVPFRSWNDIPQVVRVCRKCAQCTREAIREKRDLVLQNEKALILEIRQLRRLFAEGLLVGKRIHSHLKALKTLWCILILGNLSYYHLIFWYLTRC